MATLYKNKRIALRVAKAINMAVVCLFVTSTLFAMEYLLYPFDSTENRNE